MSNEERAINLLQSADIDKETGDVQWHTWYKGIGEDVKETFDVAIRHIQAWEKLKAYAKANLQHYQNGSMCSIAESVNGEKAWEEVIVLMEKLDKCAGDERR